MRIKKTVNARTSIIQYVFVVLIVNLLFTFLCGCSAASKTNSGAEISINQELKRKAKIFKNEQYQKGEVPLKTYIKMEGKITQTDNKDKKTVNKDDRFILVNNGVRYQMICGQNTTVKIGSKVAIWGTYYGLVKVDQIEVK